MWEMRESGPRHSLALVSLLQSILWKNMSPSLWKRHKNKLTTWKANTLNLGGRVTLAKVVLGAVPLYNMQSTFLTSFFCEDSDRIVRGFIWNETNNQKKLHLVKWSPLCLPKKKNMEVLGSRRWGNVMKLTWRNWPGNLSAIQTSLGIRLWKKGI